MFAYLWPGKPADVTDRIDYGAHQIAWVGTEVSSHDTAPGAGTWELVDHEDCEGDGMLRALTRGDVAPLCPVCSAEVRWRLTHLAPNVAADHRGVGRLP